MEFSPELAPDGVEVKFATFWQDRAKIKPRSILIHTNAAQREGTLQSAWNWAHAKPNSNTLPHYWVGLYGTARKMLPSDRRGIGNGTVTKFNSRWSSLTDAERASITQHGHIGTWSLVIETADTGTIDDPTISAFTDAQVLTISKIVAYESIVHGIPLKIIPAWHEAGVAAHTDPFTYPYTTIARGKICPGAKKKAQVRGLILPQARAWAADWTAPDPEPEPDPVGDDVMKRYLARHAVKQYEFRAGDGLRAEVYRSNEYKYLVDMLTRNYLPDEQKYFNPLTGARILKLDDVPFLNETQLDIFVGYPTGAALADEG